jgi:putative redox protein
MSTKHAILKQVQGATFAIRGDSGHWVITDIAEADGGASAGPTPKELVLFGLAGCTAVDVVNILRKKQAPVTDFSIRLRGIEAPEHPKAFKEIHLEYIIRGEGINPADVERAIELSMTKYCSVSAMLRPSVKITHSYKIEAPE